VSLVLALALGALVATDAGAGAGLAWVGTAVAMTILTTGVVVASSATVQSALALLAAVLLLRHHDRLLLAPLYGACVLLVGELAQRSLELRGSERLGPGVIGSRVGAVLLLAALGAGAGALAAIAVTIAPARSVGITAVGTAAVVGSFALIVAIARPHRRENPSGDRTSEAGHQL